MPIPIVAIIGRPNVGKSTLFNRLVKRRVAVVHDLPGVTRDRNYFLASWNRKQFYLVDTGGLVPQAQSDIERLVKEQAEIALSEADLVLFTIDGQVGAQTVDIAIARKLKKSAKKVVVVANKVDAQRQEYDTYELTRLGLGEAVTVSALNGRNVAELLDSIAQFLPETDGEAVDEETINVAVLGRPNVGKSSFVNALLGKPKLVVSEKPGTTRDAIDTLFVRDGRSYTFIDTAGLQRKARIKQDLDYYVSLRTLRSIERCDVALALIEGDLGLVRQDIRIAEQVDERFKGLIWVVNKWDLVEKDTSTADEFTKAIHRFAPGFDYAPVIFVSAKTKQRVTNVLSLVQTVHQEYHKRVATSDLNATISAAVKKQPPAAVMGKHVRILYATQTGAAPPEFLFMSNEPKLVQVSYLRYLKHQIREAFGFAGCPLKFRLRKSS